MTESSQATRAIGVELGRLLQPGDCVALHGQMGAGKTTFAGGVGEGAGIDAPLASPTYLLCCEHEGRVPLLHLDAYFEERMESLLLEGLAERFDRERVVMAEWAEKMEAWLPADRIEVRLEGFGERRSLRFQGLGPVADDRVEALRRAVTAGNTGART